jgi:hypothetical protein
MVHRGGLDSAAVGVLEKHELARLAAATVEGRAHAAGVHARSHGGILA